MLTKKFHLFYDFKFLKYLKYRQFACDVTTFYIISEIGFCYPAVESVACTIVTSVLTFWESYFLKKISSTKQNLLYMTAYDICFLMLMWRLAFALFLWTVKTPYKKECLLFGYNLVCIHQHHQGPRLLEDDNIICCQMLFWVLQQIFYGNR